MGEQTAQAVAEEAGGWAGATALGEAGAAIGALTGPAAPILIPLLGLAGGALRYFGGKTAVQGVLSFGRSVIDSEIRPWNADGSATGHECECRPPILSSAGPEYPRTSRDFRWLRTIPETFRVIPRQPRRCISMLGLVPGTVQQRPEGPVRPSC